MTDDGFRDPPEPPKQLPVSEPEPEREPEETPVANGKIRVPLSKPLSVPGRGGAEMLTYLEFRIPNGQDLVQVGNPVHFDITATPPRVEHNAPRMMDMMWRLSGIPGPILEKLDPQDLVTLFWRLTPFFMPRQGIV